MFEKLKYWARRLALNIRGFAAALVAMFLPSARPFVNKLVVFVATWVAVKVYGWLGLDFPGFDADMSSLINQVVENVIIGLGAFAAWRTPNEKPNELDKANPVVRTAVEIPPK